MKKKNHKTGLRTVALFEATKGTFGLAGSLGLLHFEHESIREVTMHALRHLGLNPGAEYSQVLLHAASGITDKNILMLAIGAMTYSVLRFIEAYGLWRQRTWAEWLAIISSAIYLPYEFYEIARHNSWIKIAITTGNILLVIYLLYVYVTNTRQKRNLTPET